VNARFLLKVLDSFQLKLYCSSNNSRGFKFLGLLVMIGAGALTYHGKLDSGDFTTIVLIVLPAFGFGGLSAKKSENENVDKKDEIS